VGHGEVCAAAERRDHGGAECCVAMARVGREVAGFWGTEEERCGARGCGGGLNGAPVISACGFGRRWRD